MRSDVALRVSLLCLLIGLGQPFPLPAGSTGSDRRAPGSTTPDREALFARCRSCAVALINDEIVRGQLVDVHADSLEIESVETAYGRDGSPFARSGTETQRASIAWNSVSSIRCGDPTWNGALAGFLVGTLPPLLFILSTGGGEGESDTAKAAAFSVGLFGSIGTVVGYLLDRSINGPVDLSPEMMRSLGSERAGAP